MNALILMRRLLSNVVQPRVPEGIHLRSVELVIRSIVYPSMPQIVFLVVLVELVSIPAVIQPDMSVISTCFGGSTWMWYVCLPVDADEATGLGVTNVVEVSPELFDSFLADGGDRACERHLCWPVREER